jgi:hypothetical protein
MGISYCLIKHFGLPLTYAYATFRQSVAGNSPFQGIVFCHLCTSKTVILQFVTTVNIVNSDQTAPISADMTFQRAGRSGWWAEITR